MKLENLIKQKLRQISESHDGKPENYMFFGNLEQMRRQCEILMEKDENAIDGIMKEHDWAQDHIAEAKSLLDQVFDFLMNELEGDGEHEHMEPEQHMQRNPSNMPIGFKPDFEIFSMNEAEELDEGKNKPTNPKLWARAKAAAKSKFKVYPSAYANGWAAKWYKSKGGGWRKAKK